MQEMGFRSLGWEHKKKKLFKKPFKKTINALVTDEEWLEVPRMSLLTYRVLPIVFAAKYF